MSPSAQSGSRRRLAGRLGRRRAAQGHAVCLLHHQRVCQPSQPLSSQPEQTAIYLPQPIWLLSTFSAVASKMEGKKRKGWGGVKRRSSDNESFLRSTQGKMLRPSTVMYALEEARQMLVEDFRWWRYKIAKKKTTEEKGNCNFFCIWFHLALKLDCKELKS